MTVSIRILSIITVSTTIKNATLNKHQTQHDSRLRTHSITFIMQHSANMRLNIMTVGITTLSITIEMQHSALTRLSVTMLSVYCCYA